MNKNPPAQAVVWVAAQPPYVQSWLYAPGTHPSWSNNLALINTHYKALSKRLHIVESTFNSFHQTLQQKMKTNESQKFKQTLSEQEQNNQP